MKRGLDLQIASHNIPPHALVNLLSVARDSLITKQAKRINVEDMDKDMEEFMEQKDQTPPEE